MTVYWCSGAHLGLGEMSGKLLTRSMFQEYKSLFCQTFILVTLRNHKFTFQSPNAENIQDLMVYFLKELQKRSKYMIPLQDFKVY